MGIEPSSQSSDPIENANDKNEDRPKPSNSQASMAEHGDADPLEKWFSQNCDIRSNDDIGEELVAFIKSHGVKSLVVTDGIIGCPHEEGIDYPEGKSCLECPYWAGRDRWTKERIQ